MPATLLAIETWLPPKLLVNAELARMAQVSEEDIFRMCGIRQRHIADLETTPSDLACQAAEKLFRRLPESRQTIDALLFCTEGLDYKAPVTACLIHERLKLPTGCLSLDVPGGCTGFVNGLLVAKGLIESGQSRQVLLLTAEAVSKVLHDDDIHLRMLFGDGAAATLIGQSPAGNLGNFVTGTDGSGAKSLWVEHSGFRDPASIEWLSGFRGTSNGMQWGRLHMQGDEILHFALSRVPKLLADTLAANQLHEDDIDLYIFHQASKIILKSLQRKCRIPREKFYLCYEDFGNTVSASIPLALHHATATGVVRSGSRVLLAGFGIGLSWGATVIRL